MSQFWKPSRRSFLAGSAGLIAAPALVRAGSVPLLGVGNAAAAGAGFSLVAHAAAGGGASNPTTAGINTSGANLLVAAIAEFQGTTPLGVVVDSNSNTWLPLTAIVGSGGVAYSRIFYCFGPTVGAGHTFSISSTSIVDASIAVQAWSGAITSPFDVENGATIVSGTSIQPGSVTPSVANSLIVTSVCLTDNTSAAGIAAPFTATDILGWVSGQHQGIGLAYFVQGAAAAINPTWSWTGGTSDSAATIAVFKP